MAKQRVRSTPFRSPRRAAAHFRASRADVLRQLGLASYINGSHFAILMVGPAGDSEVYASEALQQLLDACFSPQLLQRAKDAAARVNLRKAQDRSAEETVGGDVFGPTGAAIAMPQEPLEFDEADDSEDETLARERGVPYTKKQDSVPSVLHRPSSAAGASADPSSQPAPIQQLPTPSRPQFQSTTPTATPSSPPLVATRVTRSLSLLNADPPNLSPSLSSSAISPSATPTYVPHTFNPTTLAAWYTDRFATFPQKVSKTICKLWVKVVEPDKQIKFPYVSGEAKQPSWWPANVRHKEPDHLIKPERITLLATLLRATSHPVTDFERATGRASALIPARSAPTLDMIYKVAREERKALLANGGATFQWLTVLLPADMATDRAEEDSIASPNAEDRSNRHRSRRSITSMPSLTGSTETTPRSRQAAHPYPLARSHSVSDVHQLSPAPSRPLSRSHSLTSQMSSAGGKDRSTGSISRKGRGSLGGVTEGNEFGGHGDAGSSMAQFGLQPAISLQQQQQHQQQPGSLPSLTPDMRRHSHYGSPSFQLRDGPSPSSRPHTSPDSSLARSQSTSAMEPSFASPAMIKSRSRLSHLGSIAEGGAGGGGGAGEFGQRSTSGGSSSSHSSRPRPSVLVHAAHGLDPSTSFATDYPTPTYPPSNPLYHAQQGPAHYLPPASTHTLPHRASRLPPPPPAPLMPPPRPSPVLYQAPTFGAFPEAAPSSYYDHQPLHEHPHDPYAPHYLHQPLPLHSQQQTYFTPESLDGAGTFGGRVGGELNPPNYMHQLAEYDGYGGDLHQQPQQPHHSDFGGGMGSPQFGAGGFEGDMYGSEAERNRVDARSRYHEQVYGVQHG